MRFLALIFIGFIACGCATRMYQAQPAYLQRLSDWSLSKKNYEGFSSTIQAEVTVLHPSLIEAQVQFKSEIYGWDQDKIRSQAAIEANDSLVKSRAFLAFYTPDRRLNQLGRAQSPWRIFLDVDGKRVPAEIKRNRTPVAELRLLYPGLTRWHVPYDLVFDVPMSFLSGKSFTIQIAGPVGQQVFTFSSL